MFMLAAGFAAVTARRFLNGEPLLLQALSFCDYSLAIKAGVHYTLCGGEHL
jgi:hypothetical protein